MSTDDNRIWLSGAEVLAVVGVLEVDLHSVGLKRSFWVKKT